MKREQRGYLYAGVFIAIVIASCAVAILLTQQAAELESSDHLDSQTAPTLMNNYSFLMPEDWKYFKNAQKDIQSLTPDQSLNFGVVESKNDAGRYYFTTTARDAQDDTKALQSIYAYTSDYQFERIYKLTTSSTQTFPGIHEGAQVVFHAIGHDGNKLIVLAQDISDSPGPCTEVYMLGRESDDIAREMFSLNLADPYAKGLEPYRVPDEVYNEAMERSAACIDELTP